MLHSEKLGGKDTPSSTQSHMETCTARAVNHLCAGVEGGGRSHLLRLRCQVNLSQVTYAEGRDETSHTRCFGLRQVHAIEGYALNFSFQWFTNTLQHILHGHGLLLLMSGKLVQGNQALLDRKCPCSPVHCCAHPNWLFTLWVPDTGMFTVGSWL